MRYTSLSKVFLVILLVFWGILVVYSVNAITKDLDLGASCPTKDHDCKDNLACDHGICRGAAGTNCSANKEYCCTGTVCEDIGGGEKECRGGLFTKDQSAECLAEGNCSKCDLLMIVKNVFQLLVQIAGALAVLGIVITGIMYIAGGGALGTLTTQASAVGVEKAKNALTAVIVGFLIVLFAWSMITWMMGFLGYREPYGPWYAINCSQTEATPK